GSRTAKLPALTACMASSSCSSGSSAELRTGRGLMMDMRRNLPWWALVAGGRSRYHRRPDAGWRCRHVPAWPAPSPASCGWNDIHCVAEKEAWMADTVGSVLIVDDNVEF